jgi:hypothetical protein
MIYTVNKNPSTAAFSSDTLGCATLFYFYNQSAPSFQSQGNSLPMYREFQKWYFVTKIVLTYCEKKLF